MSKTTLTKAQVLKAFPELKDFTPNGENDFNIVAEVIGSRNPNHVWPIVNAFKAKAEVSKRLQSLFG